MAFVVEDRVKETSSSTGTGNFTLGGAPSNYRTFSAAIGVGNFTWYCINNLNANEWEVGYGQLTGATTLVRVHVTSSSNSNNLVAFSAGTKEVFCSLPAAFNNQTLGRTNMIINPHGAIQQESTAAITSGGYFADQWIGGIVGSGLAAQIGCFSAPATNISLYDTYYMFVKTTTAKASLAASDGVHILQPIEEFGVRRLRYGSALARGSWLRWRANSTHTGTASVAIRNATGTRSFVQTFNITAATPQDYALFIPGDATGTWTPVASGSMVTVTFCFAAGSDFQTATLGAWQNGNKTCGTTQSNMLDTVGRELQITDVQWSASDVLLPFEPVDYTEELIRAQRYFYSSFAGIPVTNTSNAGQLIGISASILAGSVDFPTTMRASPVVVPYSPITGVANRVRWAGVETTVNSITLVGPNRISQIETAGAGTVGGGAYFHFTANSRM